METPKKYVPFSVLRDELEARRRKFDKKTLKLLRYGDLGLTYAGNAGKSACDYKLVEAEIDERLSRFDNTPIAKLPECAEDEFMLYALFRRHADQLNLVIQWYKAKEWLKLYHSMRGLRGDWRGERKNPFLKLIYELIPKVKEEEIVPSGWADAVKCNADDFDGHFSDGRIMRDGALRASPTIEKIFSQSEDVKEMPEFVSGNLAKMLGAKPMKRKDGYKGSYEELYEEILPPEMKLEAATKIVNPPKFFYVDDEGYLR